MTSTNYASKIHTYRGHTIYPCEYAKGEHPGRWTVLVYHKTGMPYSDESCPHFQTLGDAKASVNERINDAYEYARDHGPLYHNH